MDGRSLACLECCHANLTTVFKNTINRGQAGIMDSVFTLLWLEVRCSDESIWFGPAQSWNSLANHGLIARAHALFLSHLPFCKVVVSIKYTIQSLGKCWAMDAKTLIKGYYQKTISFLVNAIMVEWSWYTGGKAPRGEEISSTSLCVYTYHICGKNKTCL